jgi:tetratricopeptide (TPR) repeat protein
MQRSLHNALLLALLALLCLACPMAWAETGFLVVHVKDVQQHPVADLQIGVEGDGGSGITDPKGKARIKLAPQTTAKSWVSLQIEKSPPGKDWVMVSPWERRTLVPSFENESENFVEVVVVQRGDRAALESGTVLKAAVQQINKANAPKSADKQADQENPKANLEAVAKQYGLSPDDLDKAIKAWGAKTTDTYEAGLAALYARNYSKATVDLQDSLKQREEKLASDQKSLAADQKQVADAAFFLGQSLWEQGKYRESAVAFQRCLQIRPDDAAVLNNTALSLKYAGDYVGAEPLYRRALAIDERAMGPDHPDVATGLNNLAGLLREKGDYGGAEPLFRQALALREKALGPDHPLTAQSLNNLAGLLREKGDYGGAEPLYRQALAIKEKALGPNDPSLATGLDNLASLLEAKGDYAGAEPLSRRALAIYEEVLGPDHPDVAICLGNLAVLLAEKGDYTGAEPLMRRAVAIDEKTLGPDHPQTRQHKENLDDLLQRSAQAAAPKAKD